MKKYFFILAFLILCRNSFAAISYESGGEDSAAPYASGSLTTSATLGVVSNGLLIVVAGDDDGSSTDNITGITWNGNALTKIDSQEANHYNTSMWYILNPSSGTHDIVTSYNYLYNIKMVYSFYSGVKQQAPEATSHSTGLTTTYNETVSDTITTITDSALIVSTAQPESTHLKNGTTNLTYRVPSNGSQDNFASDRWMILMDYVKPVAGNESTPYILFDKKHWIIINAAFEESSEVTSRRMFTIQ